MLTAGVECDDKCKFCGWHVDSVESLQQHYRYHLDNFKTSVTEDPDNGLLTVRIESSNYEEEYIFSPSRRMKPYPYLENPSIIEESARKKIFSNFPSAIPAPLSSSRREPKRKRQRQESTPTLRGLDQFRGIETGGFRDEQMDMQLLEFVDVEADDKQFASIWNYYRRRLPVIPDTGTFDAMTEFIQLNIGDLCNYRTQLLQLLIILWQYKRIGRDHILECMVLYDRMKIEGNQSQT